MYKAAIKNTWTVAEVDFSADLEHLRQRMTGAEQHLIKRLVAFFATGDSIVGNNLVLNLHKHVNSPEARMYLSRQLFEEAQHVEFYLTLLDAYVPDQEERKAAFDAIESIPSIRKKAEFCYRWIDSIQALDEIRSVRDRQNFLLNLIALRAASRVCSFLRRSRMSISCAREGCCRDSPRARTGYFAMRARTFNSLSR